MRIRRSPAALPSTGNRRRTAADDARELARKDRRLRALELRTMGATYDQIARETGVCTRQAKNDVRRALAAHGSEKVGTMRALLDRQFDDDLVRCNRALVGVTQAAMEGDSRAAVAVASLVRTKVKIAEARAKLHGLEAPQKTEVKVHHTQSQALQVMIAGMDDKRWEELVERAKERKRLAELGANLRVVR